MNKPFLHRHWLLAAAAARHPQQVIPENFSVSTNLMEAWQQVATLFSVPMDLLAEAVAEYSGFELADVQAIKLSAASYLDEAKCRSRGVLPLGEVDNVVLFAVADPSNTAQLESELRFAVGHRVKLQLLPPNLIDTYLLYLFSRAESSGLVGGSLDLDEGSASAGKGNDHHTVRLTKAIFRSAIDKKASDVHVHPFAGGGAVRLRVDGLLQRAATIPAGVLGNISRFLKSNGGMDASQHLTPQDGRLRLVYSGRDYDVRLSILPSFGGERIVARILDQGRIFNLASAGFPIAEQSGLRRLASHAAGIILLTGPTGSGKTSTLYSLLSDLNSVDVNIMTIEDPVEYVLPGTSQVQVNDKQGLGFAEALRSILRQDPDIVLVGEMRDAETANIAVQAALTGHLVFSTLHTNDAITTIPRLLKMGIEPSVLADALIGVVSQRLVRKLCEACSQSTDELQTGAEREFSRISGERPARRAVGCESCNYTGYLGRVPITERLEINPLMRENLLAGNTDLGTLKESLGTSYKSMAVSAADWIVSGATTVEEVFRVLGLRFWNELATHNNMPIREINEDILVDSGRRVTSGVLLLSADAEVAAVLSTALPYTVHSVESIAAAQAILDDGQNIVALVIDSRLAEEDGLAWLAQLREALAWSGLAAVFVVDEEDSDLFRALSEHDVASVKLDRLESLGAAVQRSIR